MDHAVSTSSQPMGEVGPSWNELSLAAPPNFDRHQSDTPLHIHASDQVKTSRPAGVVFGQSCAIGVIDYRDTCGTFLRTSALLQVQVICKLPKGNQSFF